MFFYICFMVFKNALFLFIFSSSILIAQYTDQINSNRPGASIGAFSVGKNVYQSELGFAYRNYAHSGYNNSTFDAAVGFLSIRLGFLSENLELTINSKYAIGVLNSKLISFCTVASVLAFNSPPIKISGSTKGSKTLISLGKA